MTLRCLGFDATLMPHDSSSIQGWHTPEPVLHTFAGTILHLGEVQFLELTRLGGAVILIKLMIVELKEIWKQQGSLTILKEFY